MVTKYNIGDEVYVPARVVRITVESQMPLYDVRVNSDLVKSYPENNLRANDNASMRELINDIRGALYSAAHQDNQRFKLGDIITYTPEEVISILEKKFLDNVGE